MFIFYNRFFLFSFSSIDLFICEWTKYNIEKNELRRMKKNFLHYYLKRKLYLNIKLYLLRAPAMIGNQSNDFPLKMTFFNSIVLKNI